jgi:endonuclease/exonuclease/phosphatase family metal-dependent hydrolase
MGLLRACWRRVVSAVAVAGVLLAAVTLTGGTSAASGQHTYLQFNMCGNLCNDGDLAVARHLADTIVADEPDAVTLNEVCENQYERLLADLPAYRGRFDPTGPVCDNGARYGNAILVRAPAVTLLGSWRLPSPAGGEPRRLMCLTTVPPGGPSLDVCVTHISYVPADIAAQVGAVARILHSLDSARPVLLGGDFNAEPADARLGPLYGSGIEAFEDAGLASCDGAAPSCPQHRIDYVLLSRGHWSAAHADTRDAANGLSDHEAVLATAVLLD